jgi:hypothetical protein
MIELSRSLVLTIALASVTVAAFAKGRSDDSQKDPQSGSSSPAPRAQTQTQTSAGQDARQAIMSWPQGAQAAAEAMIDRYGQPDDSTSMMLVWRDKAPFRKIAVMRDPVRHSFPVEHEDVLLQEIDMQVPADKVDDLVKFDGSLLIDRTKGTIASRCDRERNNLLALNLANEIVTGKRDSDSARRFFVDTTAKQLAGRSSSYTEKLMFTPSAFGGDPDKAELTEQGASGAGGQGSEIAPDGSTPQPKPNRKR